jgi:four helix bundle protein
MPKSYLDLKVWKLSMDLAVLIYEITNSFPRQETYGLSSQMRRCATSIPSNIAEGSARHSKRDFRHFVAIARGSSAELNTQILLSRRLGYSSPAALAQAESANSEISRMLTGLSNYLKTAPPNASPTGATGKNTND